MDAILTERATITQEYLVLPDELRVQVNQLYLARLSRLLELATAATEDLSNQEQRRLRSRAVVSTVHALTAFGEGPAASELLRHAHQA